MKPPLSILPVARRLATYLRNPRVADHQKILAAVGMLLAGTSSTIAAAVEAAKLGSTTSDVRELIADITIAGHDVGGCPNAFLERVEKAAFIARTTQEAARVARGTLTKSGLPRLSFGRRTAKPTPAPAAVHDDAWDAVAWNHFLTGSVPDLVPLPGY